jgi:hypothetical protein
MSPEFALATIASALNLPDDATPETTAGGVTDLVAAVADLRTRVYPSIVDGVLAAHGVNLP